jgi:hypothetical protein
MLGQFPPSGRLNPDVSRQTPVAPLGVPPQVCAHVLSGMAERATARLSSQRHGVTYVPGQHNSFSEKHGWHWVFSDIPGKAHNPDWSPSRRAGHAAPRGGASTGRSR